MPKGDRHHEPQLHFPRPPAPLMTERLQGGELAAAISDSVVKTLTRITGRGPMQAKATLGDNGVFIVLQDTLTVGERSLVDAGERRTVLDLRRRWQDIMRV